MIYCRKCNVHIGGEKSSCPVCQGPVEKDLDFSDSKKLGLGEEEVFPFIQSKKYSRNFVIRLISFIAVFVALTSLTVNYIFYKDYWWSLIVCGLVITFWLTTVVAINQRRNLFRSVFLELILVNLLVVLWDFFTGWDNWSIDYVFPISAVVSMGCMVLVSRLTHTESERLSFYILLVDLYGLIPGIFILLKILNVVYPSAICVCCSLISIAALLLFSTKMLIQNLRKKFHL